MPVTAYADQKCYGNIIVFQRFDDQAMYPYFVNPSNDKAKKGGEKNKTIVIQKRKPKQDEVLTKKKIETSTQKK
ncbi:hypothetical protein D3C72_371490 [compost metagenome]